jgi:transcriptional regulator with XRE-family HTH domain
MVVCPPIPQLPSAVCCENTASTKGGSQLKLAEKADLHQNAVGFIERGERSPNLHTIFLLCRALDVPVVRFMAAVEKVAANK